MLFLESYYCSPEPLTLIELLGLYKHQGQYTPEKIIAHKLDNNNKDLFLVV